MSDSDRLILGSGREGMYNSIAMNSFDEDNDKLESLMQGLEKI